MVDEIVGPSLILLLLLHQTCLVQQNGLLSALPLQTSVLELP